MKSIRRILLCSLAIVVLSGLALAGDAIEYKVIATNRTSTAQKEMNQAAEAGFRFGGVMGGDTAFGGQEVVTIMYRLPDAQKGRYVYRLLATTRTSSMQKELQEAGDAGYEYKGQTVYKSTFGGKEVVVIVELDRERKDRPKFEYRLLATQRTGTMERELLQAGAQGFEFVGVTVGQTALGGNEVVSILRKVRKD